MLVKDVLKVIVAVLVAFATFVWIESFSSSFQSCVSEQTSQHGGEASKENQSRVSIAVFAYSRCSARFVNDHNGGMTALATIFIAAFTGVIWGINRNQLNHARQVERAYLVGGGGVTREPPHTFVLDAANYGKTPASLHAFAVEICSLGDVKLPNKPKYLTAGYPRQTVVDELAPMQRKQIWTKQVPSDVCNPVIYGRFWYRDIWRDERYFSFILAVKEREGVGFGTHPDIDLTGIDPEYTAWK